VVVAARDIEPGEVVQATDLRVIEIGGSAEMRAVQRTQQDLVVGLAARGPIPEGTVMNTGLVSPRDHVVPQGWAVVGASLPRGAIPSTALAAGDRVDVLQTAERSGAPAESPRNATTIASGTVWSVRPPEGSSVSAETWVALLVPMDAREPVAQAAADGLLTLALLGADP
jgi:Flp pilus assembly protein CpaB